MKCDHVILSHGTFGLWGALLSSKKNQHVMPVSVRNKEGKQTFLDEATAIMTSGYRNFKFIDED